jgi:hypothetical protein
MTETEYPNEKIRLIAWLFGPSFDLLETHGIFGGFIALPLYGALIYWKCFRKRPKGELLGWREKTYVTLWFVLLISCIGIQIFM